MIALKQKGMANWEIAEKKKCDKITVGRYLSKFMPDYNFFPHILNEEEYLHRKKVKERKIKKYKQSLEKIEKLRECFKDRLITSKELWIINYLLPAQKKLK